MHILTGLIVAKLMGTKRKTPGSPVTLFRTGPVQTVHWIPGRVRFRSPLLVEDEGARAVVRAKLLGVRGVDSVAINGTSGSVLIGYREEAVSAELLFSAVVRLLGLDEQYQKTPPPVLTREFRNAAQSLNRAVYEQTGGLLDLSSALFIVLGAAGVKKLLDDGSMAIPAGFTLVWWSLNSLLGGRPD